MCMCMWDMIETVVAAAATAEEDAVAREGQRQADAQVAALRLDGHAFERGEAAAIRRRVKQTVASEMAPPEGQELAAMLGHLRRHK